MRESWYLDDACKMVMMKSSGGTVFQTYDLRCRQTEEISQALENNVRHLPTTKGHPTMYMRSMGMLAKCIADRGEVPCDGWLGDVPLMQDENMARFMQCLKNLVRQATKPI